MLFDIYGSKWSETRGATHKSCILMTGTTWLKLGKKGLPNGMGVEFWFAEVDVWVSGWYSDNGS